MKRRKAKYPNMCILLKLKIVRHFTSRMSRRSNLKTKRRTSSSLKLYLEIYDIKTWQASLHKKSASNGINSRAKQSLASSKNVIESRDLNLSIVDWSEQSSLNLLNLSEVSIESKWTKFKHQSPNKLVLGKIFTSILLVKINETKNYIIPKFTELV